MPLYMCICPVLRDFHHLNNTIHVSLIFKDNPFPRYIKHIITYICGLLVFPVMHHFIYNGI